MIVTVTPNPAIDVTYDVPDLVPGAVHRVTTVHRRAGGKGVNAAAVLHRLGCPVLALVPGDAELGRALAASGVPHRLLPDDRPTRRTVVVRAAAVTTAATSFWEPGEPSTADLRAAVAAHPDLDVLVVAGSLPPGTDLGLPAALAAVAGVPAVLDVSGDALRAAAAAGNAVLTPNADELAELTGTRPRDRRQAMAVARGLCRGSGVPAVLLTLGADGMVAATARQAWSAAVPERLRGNPTGAGDAAVAALARHLAGGIAGVSWPAALADAVALSGAAVAAPVAGEIDPDLAAALRARVIVEEEM